MRTFLDAAYIVLKKENKPLDAENITKKAIEQDVLSTQGKTPHHTMRARLSEDVLRNKEKSRFKRTASGAFALREWVGTEYYAPRHKKALFDEDIVVFGREHLTEFIAKKGLISFDLEEVAVRMRKICYEMRRRNAEEDESVIQLVSVFVVQHENKYLTFKRTKRLPESRLHGFYSIGFGGHISPEDLMPLFNIFDPATDDIFIIRELSEELRLKNKPMIKFRGLLYDDSRPVSKIHLGIVYDTFLKDVNYEIGEKGFLMDPKFEDINSVWNRMDDFENWSQIIIKEELRKSGLDD